ncbi:MAG: phosphoribosylamine--glycine ligase, partial [bacterium]
MKILLIGNGGRENAIAWKIYNSKSFIENNGKIFNTIGNPGINKFAEPVNINSTDINELIEFTLREKIDFTVVGPEIPLSLGIVDEFEKKGLRIFGPRKQAAEIESSKVFAKNLMLQNNIPTALHRVFSKENLEEAKEFFKQCSYPVVIKA